MNYKRIYDQIIENRIYNPIVDGYSEKHHIIPKSLGGSDDKDNIIILTAREHFICHYLLAKMFEKESFEWYKVNNAFLMMKCSSSSTQQRYFNSRLYEALRKDFSSVMSLTQKGKNNSNYGKMWICNLETKENKKIKKDEQIPEGWIKGRNKWKHIKICPECSKSFINSQNVFCTKKCRTKNLSKIAKSREVNPFAGRTHSLITKEKMKKSRNKGDNNPMYGTCWVYNDDIEKCIRIKKEDLDMYLKMGYVKGRK